MLWFSVRHAPGDTFYHAAAGLVAYDAPNVVRSTTRATVDGALPHYRGRRRGLLRSW